VLWKIVERIVEKMKKRYFTGRNGYY